MAIFGIFKKNTKEALLSFLQDKISDQTSLEDIVNVFEKMCSTNAIESLNATYRKLNRQRSVFPSDQALLKALYLSTFEAIKKWTMPLRNWGRVYGELQIMYEGRLPE